MTHKPKVKWKSDHGGRSFEAKVAWMTICVHRHIHYDPDAWLLTCHDLGIACHTLGSSKLPLAQAEAVRLIRTRLELGLAALSRAETPEADS
jgi:hypothetical protein